MNNYALTLHSTANASSATDATAAVHCKGGAAVEGDVYVGGSLYSGAVQAINPAYTLTTSALTIAASSSYYMIECTYSGAVTITLPTAAAASGRKLFFVKTPTVTTLTILAVSSDTFDGVSTTSIIISTTGYVKIHLMSNGTAIWYTI